MNLIFCKVKKVYRQVKKYKKHEFDVYKLKKHEVHFLQATETLKHEFQVLQV